MLDIIRKFRKLLDARERRNAVLLFFMILATGVMEAVGVASVMPFLSVLSDPGMIQSNAYLGFAYQSFGFSDTNSFLLFLGSAVFVLVVTGLGLKSLTMYGIARFTHMRNYTISTKLLRSYLERPYSWFLNRHSADMGKTILSEVQQVIGQALLPTAQFIANAVIASCLILMLLMIDPLVALVAFVLFAGAYGLLYSVLRKYLSRIGADRVKANRERFQISQEALGGIKEVKAAGIEAGYIASFIKPAQRFAKCLAANMIAGQVPRFALEALAFGGILLIILILLATRGGDLGQIIPTLGVFAFAGQRLMPTLQNVYRSATKMRFGKPALDDLYKDMANIDFEIKDIRRMRCAQSTAPLGLKQSLELVDVNFWYPNTDRPALQELNLKIAAKSTVGFVGPTGAGKTTAVDLILGLLCPQSGQMLVDGRPLFIHDSSTEVAPSQKKDSNLLFSWQRTLGYVPQEIFLADDTVEANIAFGVPQEEIDPDAVERAARIAELHEFVQNELSDGYQTVVGERGVRLSGGQRQRIGIARALYHDPDVLVMDEATAALDNLTEKAVMQAVHNLSNKKTIILIAHRLSTVQNCDQIFLLEHGRLIAQGTYSVLLESSQEFQRMAAVNE